MQIQKLLQFVRAKLLWKGITFKELTRMELESSTNIVSSSLGQKRKQSEEEKVTDPKRSKHSAKTVNEENVDSNRLSTEKQYPKKHQKRPSHNLYSKQRLNANAFSKDETSYYFENGFRKVHPYYFTFHSFCKNRWLGKTLREVYSTEFRFYPIKFYEKSIESGNMLLNMKRVESLDVKLKSNDMITSKIHRHEGPVLESKIEILVNNSKYVVVNKPSSIPIHPCGRYRNNSLCYILKKEFDLENLHGCHRIDRLTSGIVIFAKTKHFANKIIGEIRERKVEKEYICKVVGLFPLGSDAEPIVCEQPVTVFDHKLGLCAAWEVEGLAEQAKDAFTEFRRISTDGETSVVLCKPKTGRTHQIRVHLQYLGFPIVNDPLYNNEAWGEDRFKPGPCSRNVREVAHDISRTYDNDPYKYLRKSDTKSEPSGTGCGESDGQQRNTTGLTSGNTSANLSSVGGESVNSSTRLEPNSSPQVPDNEIVSSTDPYYVSDCEECKNPLPDPEMKWMHMYLHAFSYKGTDWEFKSPMPEWTDDSSTETKIPCEATA